MSQERVVEADRRYSRFEGGSARKRADEFLVLSCCPLWSPLRHVFLHSSWAVSFRTVGPRCLRVSVTPRVRPALVLSRSNLTLLPPYRHDNAARCGVSVAGPQRRLAVLRCWLCGHVRVHGLRGRGGVCGVPGRYVFSLRVQVAVRTSMMRCLGRRSSHGFVRDSHFLASFSCGVQRCCFEFCPGWQPW